MKLMSDQKTIGIACDNYKLRRFKRLLTKAGFKHTAKDWIEGTTLIEIITSSDNINKIHRICKQVEIDSKLGN